MASRTDRFQIRRLQGPEDLSAWDRFVLHSPQSNPFSTSAWLQYGAAPCGAVVEIWVALKGDEWIAGIPVTYRRRLGIPWYFGLPLAAYSTPLFRTPTSTQPARTTTELLEATTTLASVMTGRARGSSFLLHPSIGDVRSWIWQAWKAVPRYTYLLDLTKPLAISDSVRRHLRKSREAKLQAAFSWQIDPFLELFDETQRRQGFGVRISRSGLRELATDLHHAGIAWMATALSETGEALASQILLSIEKSPRVVMWVAGSRSQSLASGASAWLMCEIAEEAGRRGFLEWDLCGADLPGVARFKSEFGGQLVPYFQIDSPMTWPEQILRVAVTTARAVTRGRQKPAAEPS